MFKNYLKIGLRNLLRHKGYSLINIAGLAAGLASCLVIMLYIKFEISYDNFHRNGDQVYRVRMDRFKNNELSFRSAVTYPAVGPAMKRDIPGILEYARLLPTSGTMQYHDRIFREEKLFYADSAFLKIFSFPLVQGHREGALSEPYTAAVSASMAKKYFGEANPLGEIIKFNGTTDLKIAEVFQEVPANSHLHFNALISLATLKAFLDPETRKSFEENWGWYDFYTYILTSPGTGRAALEAQFPALIEKYKGKALRANNAREEFILQPLRDIHLYSNLSWEAAVNGNGKLIYFLLIIALFIIVIAWVNFVNLSTARALERAREVGVRKVVGAARSQLVKQFLLEALLINFLAAVISLTLIEAVLPYFNQLIGIKLALDLSSDADLLAGMVGLFALGALGAGVYPAVLLSSFLPTTVLKGKFTTHAKGLLLRKSLVIFQFAISIALIIGTLTVFKQLDYMRNQDLGINLRQTLVIHAPRVIRDRERLPQDLGIFKNQLLQNPSIYGFTASSGIPGRENFWINKFTVKGAKDDESQSIYVTGVDYDFITAFEIKLLAGRNFSREFGSDEKEAFVINESAARLLRFKTPEEALGKVIVWGDEERKVVGVIKDFHQASLKLTITPNIFVLAPTAASFFAVKIKTENLPDALASIQTTWNATFPDNPFDWFFLDEFFNKQYQADRQFGQVFTLFAGLAIIIACLGLFGLASYTVARKTKEIGIRKVLGASLTGIVGVLSKDFVKLVLAANLIAWPIAWYVMSRWLQDFAYRIDIGWWVFALAGGLALIIALITVSTQAIKAALANPLEALRYE
jgi:putative ABC transport system permease protein